MHIKSLMINIYTLTLRTKELKQTITFPDVHYKNNQLSFIKTGPYFQGVRGSIRGLPADQCQVKLTSTDTT